MLRSQPPNLQRIKGATSPRLKLIKPSKLLPQPTPSTSYILEANSGKEKPAIVLTNAAAPVALAAYVVYVSTTYA